MRLLASGHVKSTKIPSLHHFLFPEIASCFWVFLRNWNKSYLRQSLRTFLVPEKLVSINYLRYCYCFTSEKGLEKGVFVV